MIEIILLLACCCFIFIVVLAGWFLNRGEEGDECKGKDKNGTYEIDEDLKCVLKSCDTKYYKSGKKCIADQSGDTCVPIGTPDPQGTYLTTQIGGCELISCATGYYKSGKECLKTTTTFVGSEIPNDALVIETGEIPMGEVFNSPKDSTDAESTYYFNLQSDGQLVWVKRGTGTVWAMGSNITMPGTRMYFQGDGNICARGATDMCMNSAGGSRVPTHDVSVPAGQHKIVGTKEGLLYVDHGTGVSGRSVIYTPPSTTETYVLPY